MTTYDFLLANMQISELCEHLTTKGWNGTAKGHKEVLYKMLYTKPNGHTITAHFHINIKDEAPMIWVEDTETMASAQHFSNITAAAKYLLNSQK